MMKGPRSYAIAVRKASGEILVHREQLKGIDKKYPIFKLPVFRGMFALIDTMVLGVKRWPFPPSRWISKAAWSRRGLTSSGKGF